MIQFLTNEEAGSQRGKANCLKGQAWRLSTMTLSVSPPTSRPGLHSTQGTIIVFILSSFILTGLDTELFSFARLFTLS